MSEEIITSRQNPSVKFLCSLEQKKYRVENGMFRFDGIKLYREAAECGVETVNIYLNASKYPVIAERAGITIKDKSRVILLSEDIFNRVSGEISPEGIITVAKYLDKSHKIATINNKGKFTVLPARDESIILLEGIRDPGNLGTVIRSAAALGIDRMIITSDCADIYNTKTIRAAMGALFRQKITIVNPGDIAEYISDLRATGRRVLAAALRAGAAELGEFELFDGDCFVIGNEGHGLSDRAIEACDMSVIIPMEKGCESLNAAMAATLCIWETRRAGTRCRK